MAGPSANTPSGIGDRHGLRGLRMGLTIVETMVALSVVSFLAALLIPAVQMARESARRGQCLHNIREVVQACASYESAQKGFPYTAVQFQDADKKMHPPCSPHECILPYLDQGAVFGDIDFGDLPIDLAGKPPSSMKNGAIIPFAIAVFRCPTDPGRAGGNNYRACMGFGPGIYSPSETRVCADPGNAAGAFVNGRSVTPAEFLDGLSNTVMFSERVMGSQGAFRPYSDFLVALPNICSTGDAIATCGSLPPALYDAFGGSTWLYGGWRQTWYNHLFAPNSSIPDCNAGPVMAGGGNGAYTARSYHPGGVNCAMADGSVRFVSEQIEIVVWRAMSTRRGGETLDAARNQ